MASGRSSPCVSEMTPMMWGWFMGWNHTIAGESHTKNALLRPRLFLLARFPVPTGNQDSRELPLFARLAQKTLLNEAKIIIMRYRRKLLRNNRNTAGRNRY